MTTPTLEKLYIYINGKNVSDKVVDPGHPSLRITEERGKRISQATFNLRDGAALGLALWAVVLITSTSYANTYMWGYITDLTETKNGITLDYAIQVSRAEVRFSKAIINGTFTGTDTEILAWILANSIPDLSSLFDFSTGVTGLSSGDFTFEANEMTALDAIDKLAQEVGADWGWTIGDRKDRTNLTLNPNLAANANYYGGAIAGNSSLNTAPWTDWNTANFAYNGAGGESGGGIVLTLQEIAAPTMSGFFRLGRATDGGSNTFTYTRAEEDTNQYLMITFRSKITGAGSVGTASVELITYNSGGSYRAREAKAMSPLVGTIWRTQWEFFDLTDTTLFDSSGEFELQFLVNGGATTTEVSFDKFLVEVIISASDPTSAPTYFDGDTSGAVWNGTDHDSTSTIAADKHQLDWDNVPADAPYDLDIGTTDFVGDIDFNFAGLDGINHMIVIGGYQWVSKVWEFHANNSNIVFDLPVEMFPASGDSVIVVAQNDGSDATPSWTNKTVQERIGNTLGSGNDLLWSQENFYLEWATAPRNLARAFRVTARIKERIRATVTDSTNITSTGVELADTIYDDTITTEADAHAAGFAALEARKAALHISFTTYTPGLKPNQEIDIADSSRPGGTRTVIIQKVIREYLGGGVTKFRIEAGQQAPNLVDQLIKTRRLAEEKPPLDAETGATTLDTILDGNDEPILDGNYQPIYQVTP